MRGQERTDIQRVEFELCPDPAALGRLRSLGGAALLQKMIALFVENTPKRVRAAMDGEKTGNWYQVERAAHSLKSTASTLGLAGIQSLAREVEDLAEREESEGMAPLLHEIDSLFHAVKTLLEQEGRSAHA